MKRIEMKKQEAIQLLKEEEASHKIVQELQAERIRKEKEARKHQAEERLRKKEELKQVRDAEWEMSKRVEIKLPLYKHLEIQFNNKQEEEENEKQAKALEERKARCVSVSKKEIGKFAHRVEMIVEELNFKRRQEREKSMFIEIKPSLKTQTYKDLVEKEKMEKLQKEQEHIRKQELLNKKKQYAKFIKLAHRPVVDE